MSLETPIKIRELQRKLYTKARQEANYRFYLLYDKISGKTFSGGHTNWRKPIEARLEWIN